MSKSKLIRDFTSTDPIDTKALEGFYICVAKSIENSLLEAGAIAGEDYNIIDIYTLAQPFVLDTFKEGKLCLNDGS